MEILFLTLEDFDSYGTSNMYADVMKEFIFHGHHVHTISPVPKSKSCKTYMNREGTSSILRICTDDTRSNRNLIRKGISTILIGHVFTKAIKKYYKNVKFDLIVYSTPPITLVHPIRYVKRKYGAKTYLMLKDIFPQNAVDLGMLSKRGVRSLPWCYFRIREKQLYGVSDYIGCMSPANVDYLLKHNKKVEPSTVNICPNSLKLLEEKKTEMSSIRRQFGIPQNQTVFVYGGNLGKPQGVEFIVACLKAVSQREDVFFVIAGSGTEYEYLSKQIEDIQNVKIMSTLPVEEYNRLVSCCDVGLIFLDYRFSIPNFPSRLLSYTQYGKPVLCITDACTDIGKIAVENQFGWSCESKNVKEFLKYIDLISNTDELNQYGVNAKRYHEKHYLPIHSYKAIMEAIDGNACSSN